MYIFCIILIHFLSEEKLINQFLILIIFFAGNN